MSVTDEILQEDLYAIMQSPSIPWDKLVGGKILLTGATGLIGSYILRSLALVNREKQLQLKLYAMVRDVSAAALKFSDLSDCVEYLSGTVEHITSLPEGITHIIHCASPTTSAYFATFPVETAKTILCGTMNLLDAAVKMNVHRFVFLSSMEAYGAVHTDDLLTETSCCMIDTMTPRNCYPEAKRMCECLCAAYSAEYPISAMSVRLAQTFGPGVRQNDHRVFAEFARCVKEKHDIILKTKGDSKRCYLYTADAVSAILTVLLRGEAGNVYNAANPDTYCSIYEMAQLISRELTESQIEVIVQLDDEIKSIFSPPHKLNLSIEKLEALGWHPSTDLLTMYRRMLAAINE